MDVKVLVSVDVAQLVELTDPLDVSIEVSVEVPVVVPLLVAGNVQVDD